VYSVSAKTGGCCQNKKVQKLTEVLIVSFDDVVLGIGKIKEITQRDSSFTDLFPLGTL